jgi:hypothetical protein
MGRYSLHVISGFTLNALRYRDDWGMRHFLHPKLLRKAREVRVQLEDIMKFQKMEIISTGTDFDVLRYVIIIHYSPKVINM